MNIDLLNISEGEKNSEIVPENFTGKSVVEWMEILFPKNYVGTLNAGKKKTVEEEDEIFDEDDLDEFNTDDDEDEDEWKEDLEWEEEDWDDEDIIDEDELYKNGDKFDFEDLKDFDDDDDDLFDDDNF